jgi:hypothetical protein
MKAIHMAHDRRKLMDLACELARKFDLELPPGLKAWEEKRKFDKDALDPTLGEKAQEEATGISPEQRRAEITACYEQADNAQGFINALEQKGYMLARGDRRGFVVVDRFGAPHSLTRYVKGHKAKDMKAKLADVTPEQLPSVAQAKELQRQRKQAEGERQSEKDRSHAEQRRKKARQALAEKHAARRAELLTAEQELLTRQQSESLALHAAQLTESSGILFRVRSAVAELVGKTPGLRSVLGHIQKMTHLDPNERHQLERFALARRHGREKKDSERQKRLALRIENREKQSLEKALRREAGLARELDGKAKHDFSEAALDQAAQQDAGSGSEDLTVDFNDAAEFVEGADRAGEDDDDHAPGWKERSNNLRPGRKPKRSKGYGYRRDSD